MPPSNVLRGMSKNFWTCQHRSAFHDLIPYFLHCLFICNLFVSYKKCSSPSPLRSSLLRASSGGPWKKYFHIHMLIIHLRRTTNTFVGHHVLTKAHFPHLNIDPVVPFLLPFLWICKYVSWTYWSSVLVTIINTDVPFPIFHSPSTAINVSSSLLHSK